MVRAEPVPANRRSVGMWRERTPRVLALALSSASVYYQSQVRMALLLPSKSVGMWRERTPRVLALALSLASVYYQSQPRMALLLPVRMGFA
jgi:hypothetical protein